MSWNISVAASCSASVPAIEAGCSNAGGLPEQRPPDLRVLVIGTSGSGKSTFAQALAARTGIAWHELDLINWHPGWYNRHTREPEAFLADVDAATASGNWVVSGGYSTTRPIILPRLTDLVWLDLPRWQVMAQVINRSLRRAAGDREVFPGCHEHWSRLLRRDHPIRWAWNHHAPNRLKFAGQAQAAAAHGARVHRCTNRGEADRVLDRVAAAVSGLGNAHISVMQDWYGETQTGRQ
jgi:adenylate kinase family enzyme